MTPSLKGKNETLPIKEADMISVTDEAVHIQTSSELQFATPIALYNHIIFIYLPHPHCSKRQHFPTFSIGMLHNKPLGAAVKTLRS